MPRLHITQSSSSQTFVPKSPEEDATARYSVSVPLPSTHIHQVSAKLFVGYLRELPTSDVISNNWEDGVKEELDTYLCSGIRPLNWSEKKATVESVLCVACIMTTSTIDEPFN